VNWHAYVANNPVTRTDPYGLDWLDDASNLSAGFADTITFGLTGLARQALGTDVVVNRNSGMYAGGSWAGVGWSVAMGGAMGAKAAGAKGAGTEFSHLWPTRRGGPRSIWNGNYVSKARHALHDPHRMLKGMTKADKLWPGIQQLDRIPRFPLGIGAGLGYGLLGRAVNGDDGPC